MALIKTKKGGSKKGSSKMVVAGPVKSSGSMKGC